MELPFWYGAVSVPVTITIRLADNSLVLARLGEPQLLETSLPSGLTHRIGVHLLLWLNAIYTCAACLLDRILGRRGTFRAWFSSSAIA